jgi:hypothetical protein
MFGFQDHEDQPELEEGDYVLSYGDGWRSAILGTKQLGLFCIEPFPNRDIVKRMATSFNRFLTYSKIDPSDWFYIEHDYFLSFRAFDKCSLYLKEYGNDGLPYLKVVPHPGLEGKDACFVALVRPEMQDTGWICMRWDGSFVSLGADPNQPHKVFLCKRDIVTAFCFAVNEEIRRKPKRGLDWIKITI